MDYIDVFNGDADGITALHQWRMEYPVESSTLITGVKRDIQLLARVSPQDGQTVTVFDISLKSNMAHLEKLSKSEIKIVWFDHHQRGGFKGSENFTLHIDEDPATCTSSIVNTALKGRYPGWAAVGAFGDNSKALGAKLASEAGASASESEKLSELGILLNYNSYGETLDDLYSSPLEVYREMSSYREPLPFFHNSSLVDKLRAGYRDDFAKIETVSSDDFGACGAIYYLPDERWARRIVGTWANKLSLESRERAHAVLLRKRGGWLVSVRSPKSNPFGADTLCSSFESGGGRGAAAGINFLPDITLSSFAERFKKSFL